MKIPIYQVDAFTGKLFAGNPAAVCPLESWPGDRLMQDIAFENNLSETAFFVRKEDYFELRWFTPAAEVNLCGHATLASAHVLFHHLGYSADKIKFMSKSGGLMVTRTADLLTMDFPATRISPIQPPPGLAEGLGKAPMDLFMGFDLLALYRTEADILALKPNFDRLSKVEARGIIVTAPGKECDFVSRFFAPRVGVNEDPVTGSAHTALIPFWAGRLGRKKLYARQISRRGGELFCEDLGDRILISGRAVTFLVGELEV